MEQILLVIIGILGVGISVAVKLIFLCMGAEPQQQQQQQQPANTRPARRRHPAARRRP